MKAKIIIFILSMALFAKAVEDTTQVENVSIPQPIVKAAPVPLKTFLTIQRYKLENNGEDDDLRLSQIKMEISIPNSEPLNLPEGGGYWNLVNGQFQEINRTIEIPAEAIKNDNLKFTIQLYRKGSEMLPCNFDVQRISEYNRVYYCHTDLLSQSVKGIVQNRLDKEGVEIRIYTELNVVPKTAQEDSLAVIK